MDVDEAQARMQEIQRIMERATLFTLLPGTVLSTGTPAGCAFAHKPPTWMKHGDVFEVDIEGIGVLRNPVVGK